MSVKGPIIIIEDDSDDREFYESTLKDLEVENEIIFFDDAEDAYKFLEQTSKKPFIILSDINLPGMSGIEFKKKIQSDHYLRSKSIPFVFLTTSSNQATVATAYLMMVQGYFIKPNSVTELAAMLKQIIEYWKICKHPNSEP
jgi:CheY-like chemotaxis protein